MRTRALIIAWGVVPILLVLSIGWGIGSDSMVAVAAWVSDTLLKLAISENSGSSWTEVSSTGFGFADTLGAHIRQPIKIVLDPATSGSSRDIYVLMGVDVNGGTRRELWRSQTNGTSFEPIVQAGGTSDSIKVVDIAIDPDATVGNFAVAISSSFDRSTSGPAPLDTSDRCDAASPKTDRLSNTHCSVRPGRPTSVRSVTTRSNQRLTVTIGEASVRSAASSTRLSASGGSGNTPDSACHGTAQMTARRRRIGRNSKG